ncbi:MAG: protoporphyrinogen/coproporphyrinogen oxidase [Gemmatimonadota bacterium]
MGAGISGLAAAHGLRERGVPVTLFEASARAGGVIRSSRVGDRLLEWGPQRLRLTPALASLTRRLDLEACIVRAPSNAPLYIARGGRLHEVPRSVRDLAAGSLLSPAGRFRVLLEPLTPGVRSDETVAAALSRKFGTEAYRVLLGPLFGGLFGSDPADMRAADSLNGFIDRAGAPRSLLIHALRLGGSADVPDAISFTDGLGTLPEALARSLGSDVCLEHPVNALERTDAGWVIDAGGSEVGPFDGVVLAVPADMAGRILRSVTPATADRLAGLVYNKLAIVHMAADGTRTPGFGYQVAFDEPLETRGVTFNDWLFDRRDVVTSFLGGARNRRLTEWSDDRIAAIAATEFRQLTGRSAEVIEISRARIPSFDGSWRALDGLELPAGVSLCAGYLERPGVSGRLAQAERVAAKLV